MSYAIVKIPPHGHQVAITRTGIAMVIYLLFWGAFYVGYMTHNWPMAMLLMAGLATIGPAIQRRMQRKADDILLAEQRRYQQILLQAASGMAREHDLDRLVRLIVYLLQRTIKIHFAVFFLDNGEQDSTSLSR